MQKVIFSLLMNVVYQSEAAECGLACMAMVANYHGHQLDLTTLRNRYSVSLKGANLPSGTGKTSLMKIMLGLLPAESGKVEVDGIDIRHLGLRHYRGQIAAVMQDDQLMSGTLAENISFFDPQLDMHRVVEAAQLAGIHPDISTMPMGYNSLVGDMGSSLSGGQKQRVLLARALYRKPKILFMDEATSHLDVQLEHYVNQAIKQLNMTRIVIAHRPETILNAERIMQLSQGQLQDITAAYKAQFGIGITNQN
jgi:ATP-binding cassette subfamily B protein RaxB